MMILQVILKMGRIEAGKINYKAFYWTVRTISQSTFDWALFFIHYILIIAGRNSPRKKNRLALGETATA